jgi:PAS domain S-box-containing protein
LKTNLFLFVLAIFIISLIITLNIFFQQNYQSEMAGQFNRQQLLIAKSIANSIETDMQRLEEEVLSFAMLMAYRELDDKNLGEFVNNAFAERREDINIKLLDNKGRLRYSSLEESLSEKDLEMFEIAKKITPGDVLFLDMIAENRKIVLLTPIVRNSDYKGVLLMEIMINVISKKFLAPFRAGIRGYTWMMDSNGTLMYHPTQPDMVGKNLYKTDKSCFGCHKSFEVEKKILDSEGIGVSSYIAPYGEDKLIAFSRIKIPQMSWAWFICVSIPYSEVTFSIRKSMKLHSLLVISIFLATVIVSFTIILINRKRIKAEARTMHLERQRHLEEEIIQAKDYLENLLESTESKIMVLDNRMIIRTVNSAHEKLCSRKKEEIIGKSFFDVFPIESEGDTHMIKNILKKCLAGSSQRLNNYPYVREDKTINLNISISPLILHGEVSGIILASSDVTEEANLREELKNYASKLEDIVKERTIELFSEKEKLNAIVETLEAGLFLVNSSRRIIWINRTLKEWLGEEGIKDVSLERIYGENEIYRSIVDNKIVQEIIYRDLGKRKGYFQVTSTPLIDSEGNFQALVLIQDITEMKKVEEQMMHSEKLSALSRISAGIAHEIGNPLTSISSYVQILREMDFDDFTKESLDTIAKHIARIVDIVRQMSSFSKTASSDLKQHDIHKLIALTLELVKYDKRMKGVSLNIDLPDNLPNVKVDETQLIQVFMNIILNAADAMPHGGTLDITAMKLDGENIVSFSDSGTGIPEEYLEKIFDPFFTTKEKGTGLGLAVSYSIIKSYQGDISFENQPEGGAIFKVRLPFYES